MASSAATQLLASSHISLMHGWVPITAQAVAATVLVLGIGWRSRRWRLLWLPTAGAGGGAAAAGTHWYIADRGLARGPPARDLWAWVALTGVAAAVLILGWRSARWWRRGATVLAVPLCLLCTTLVLNLW